MKIINNFICFILFSVMILSFLPTNFNFFSQNENYINNLKFHRMNLEKMKIGNKSFEYLYGNAVTYNNGIIVTNQEGFTYLKFNKINNKYNYQNYKLPNLDNDSMYLPRVYYDKNEKLLYFGIKTYLYVQKTVNSLNQFIKYDVDDSDNAPFSSLAGTWYDMKKIGNYLFNATREGFWYTDITKIYENNNKSIWKPISFENKAPGSLLNNSFGKSLYWINKKIYTGTYSGSTGLAVAPYDPTSDTFGKFTQYNIGPKINKPDPYTWNDTMDMKLSPSGLLYIANYDYNQTLNNNMINLGDDNNLYLNVSKSKNDLVHFDKYNIDNIKKIEFDMNNNLYLINDNSLRISKNYKNISSGFYTYKFDEQAGIGDAYIDNNTVLLTCDNGDGGIYFANFNYFSGNNKKHFKDDYYIPIIIGILVVTTASYILYNGFLIRKKYKNK